MHGNLKGIVVNIFDKTLTKSVGYLLVIHGSRDRRTQIGVQQLAEQVRDELAHRGEKAPVDIGTLELGELRLHAQIEQWGDHLRQQGISYLHIIPLFLLPGTHVMEDIPREVNLAQKHLGNGITLGLCPYLGNHPQRSSLLLGAVDQIPREAWIIMAHGSRRVGGNQPIEALANQLGMVDAYWSMMPSLEVRVKELIDVGYGQIGVIPYFLFPGYITDAIAQTLAEIQLHYPQLNYWISPPLHQHPHLPSMVLDLTVS